MVLAMLSLLIYIIVILFLVVMSMFIPIGNENSTVRRVPWITFIIMGLNVFIYYVTLPGQAASLKEVMAAASELEKFMASNSEIMADDDIRNKLLSEGLISKEQADDIKDTFKREPELQRDYEAWLRGPEAQRQREEFKKKLGALTAAREGMLWFKYGLAPNGKWKIYQLITAAFLHG